MAKKTDTDTLKKTIKELKQQLTFSQQGKESYENVATNRMTEIRNLKGELNKTKEVLKREEAGFLNRISNLECSLEDSFEDNQRLQIVINTLGGRINILEKTNRSNLKRFRQTFNDHENQNLAVMSPSFNYKGTNFKRDPDLSSDLQFNP